MSIAIVCLQCNKEFYGFKASTVCAKCRQKNYKNKPEVRARANQLAVIRYHKNPKFFRNKNVIYKEKHPYNQRDYIRRTSKELKFKVLDLLGDKCVHCGFKDYRALQIDHIYGDGRHERAKLRTRSMICYYRSILRNPKAKEIYQILCANCNWIKVYDNNEGPYQTPWQNRQEQHESKARKTRPEDSPTDITIQEVSIECADTSSSNQLAISSETMANLFE